MQLHIKLVLLGDSYGKLTRSRFCYLVLEKWYHRYDGVIGLVMLVCDRFVDLSRKATRCAFTQYSEANANASQKTSNQHNAI